jgi:hypothetical protein
MQSVEKPRYACAQWDYEAIEDNELTFKTGDYIEIVSTENEDWWEGILNGFQGFFPANRVEEVKNEELEIVTESVNSRRNTINQQDLNVVTTPSDVNYGSPYMAEPTISPLTATTTTTSDVQYSPELSGFNIESIIESQLPDNWKVEYDPSGKIYYKNTQTNEVTWELPVYNSKIEEYEEDLPQGWKAEYNNGNVYYYNIYTNETSWDKPKKTQGTFEVRYEEPKEVDESNSSEKIRINLPPDKIKRSGKLPIKYEKGSVKFSLKQCSIILCGSLLLLYKEITGKLSENLPAGFVKLKGCTVDKAGKNVTKKKNALVINSAIGEEIILFCGCESDVNSWIDDIRKSSNEDNDDSKIVEVLTKITTKTDGSKKDKDKDKDKDKESIKNKKNSQDDEKHKNKKFGKIFGNKRTDSQSEISTDYLIFGGTLEEQVQKEGSKIPRVVEECIREIVKKGIETEGIYRLSGNTSVVNKLKAMYNKGETIDFDDDSIDLPVIASLIKLYFRELKDTLIPTSMYDSFMDALKNPNHDEKLYQLNDLIHQLPKVNYDVLAYLMKHLKEVSKKSDENKMEINNLAIVFGPTLISRSTDKDAVAATLIADMPQQNRLIECIITYEDWFFQNDEN